LVSQNFFIKRLISRTLC